MEIESIKKLDEARKRLFSSIEFVNSSRKGEEEGGCGVVGLCCTKPVAGIHIYEPSMQMHNRGNGKGGGIAAVGFVPEQLGVSRDVLENFYMLHIAFLDASIQRDIEKEFIEPYYDVTSSGKLDQVEDWKKVDGLEVKPPEVCRYFVRVKPEVLDTFIARNNFETLDRTEAEDEFISQNSFLLNQKYYTSLGEKKAFVLSYGKNIMILKVVGYAEAIVKYYKIEDLCAHVWISHQRYPTKGRVWHPGGAHPFAAINTALVHNGDFANYHSVTEYLKQRNIFPQFLTDTEVAVQIFDLYNRTYHYPLEYIIEALAPTTELDFDLLSEEKQRIYRNIQATHMHGSPDGPWFFIIARTIPDEKQFQLLGITDTAMLRPQVFAFSDGDIQVGLISSEKQAIDATLLSLSRENSLIKPVADRYWNARGGSHTDGGAFIFNLSEDSSGIMTLTCMDKFGVPVVLPEGKESYYSSGDTSISPESIAEMRKSIRELFVSKGSSEAFSYVRDNVSNWTYSKFLTACRSIAMLAKEPELTRLSIETLTLLNDRKYPAGNKRRSHLLSIIRNELDSVFRAIPSISDETSPNSLRMINFENRNMLRPPRQGETVLVIDASQFQPEGELCDSALLMDAYIAGWRNFISFGYLGQRFTGCGLGPGSNEVTIDVYGSAGDYLGSGIDGLTIRVHNNAQDQIAQILKSGKLVIHGDVGQAFMYGAKGGSVFVAGNAAGRPLINAVGKPRLIINGTCLDFLAESFMAGDPLDGGGFVILNGLTFSDNGEISFLSHPYPGSNLFSLASGGAIYIRDPHNTLVDQQLNGGKFAEFSDRDWALILPYLEENGKLFDIPVDLLLTVDGKLSKPGEVYRKVTPVGKKVTATETAEVFENEESED